MHVKWIVCQVKEGCKPAFSTSQAQWGLTQSQPGFLGQVGGWNMKRENEACILSCWQDQRSYATFMRELHDRIFHRNRQRETYEHCEVHRFDTVLNMSGKYTGIIASIREGKYLHIADCTVRGDRVKHFLRVRNEIWLPGTSEAAGMLGGVFSRSVADDRRFLVAALWRSAAAHRRYVSRQLPELQARTNSAGDLEAIEEKFIALEPGWRIGRAAFDVV